MTATVEIVEPAASKSIIQAILAVRAAAPILGKDHDNKFSNYKYVSIDQFYETIKPLASNAGLIWRARMIDWKINMDVGKAGSVMAVVAFDLYHKDGTSFVDYMTVPIINSLVGAQTSGQIFSYAEKVFMRAAFGVATGEADADHTDQGQFSRENKKPQEKIPEQPKIEAEPAKDGYIARDTKDGFPIINTKTLTSDAVGMIEAIFDTWMDKPKSKTALRNWFAENVPALEKLKGLDEAAEARVMTKFTARAQELK
jgi:hypothetical protein